MTEKATIHVTVWNEFVHEKENPVVAKIYPDGIHGAIAGFLRADAALAVRTATLDEPEHGLSEEVLAKTDVLLWWGHTAHQRVSDEVVARVHRRVLEGMGLIVLHSGHNSKIFHRLMGTTCSLRWREDGDHERLWVVEPSHPITRGLPLWFEIDNDEVYGERFDIPAPDELLLLGWYNGGEVFRSGCTWTRGYGRVFYFQPGHETYPVYHNEHVQHVIRNAVHWANRSFDGLPVIDGRHEKPLEPLA